MSASAYNRSVKCTLPEFVERARAWNDTLADAVNSLTFIGGAIDNAQEREDVEIAAGEILMNPPSRLIGNRRNIRDI